MKFKHNLLFALISASAVVAGCKPVAAPAPKEVAETIYTGGNIVTVNDAQPTVEALAVKDGMILAVGTRGEIEAYRGSSSTMVDLGGKTLLPGFIDAHSHFLFALDMLAQANISPPPVGPVGSIADIVTSLQEIQQRLKIPKGEWIVGWGYDGNELAEKREATRDDLDPAFPDNPVMAIHVSGHGAVLNSAALRKFNITAKTPTPPGGVIVRKPGSQEPAGLLMEAAYLPVFAQLPKPSQEELFKRMDGAQQMYASNGYTTIQEGATHAPDLEFLRKAASQKLLYLDLVSLPIFLDLAKVLEQNPPGTWGRYDNRLKLGGVKSVFDGSPQGKTAYFTQPYLTGGPEGQKSWRGEPTFSEDTYLKLMKPIYDNNLRSFNHANGDAAVDMFLDVHEKLGGKAELRPVVIHSQFVRADQLGRYARLGVVPALYPMHTYFFGDVHVRNLGMARAGFMSPAQSAIQKGLHVTIHSDFNVLPLDPMLSMWTAMNRTTRTGVVLGAGERLTAIQALKALTIESAYEYMEESSKGSLEPGKLADLVILSGNPITTSGDAIRDIKIVETIKEGKSVYKLEPK